MATKEEILKKALNVFAKKGYESTNLDEIAKEVGITKPAIYYHFKNKKSLYNEVFKTEFAKLHFKKQDTFEENLKHYIFTLGEFFIKNPQTAKLFSKELSNEAMHLEDDTLKIISKTLKFLTNTLEQKHLNPIFIQTIVVSSLTTYANTLNLRSRITGIVKDEKLTRNFDITNEIYKTVISYIKANQ